MNFLMSFGRLLLGALSVIGFIISCVMFLIPQQVERIAWHVLSAGLLALSGIGFWIAFIK